jgi:hypothetical protein
MKIIEMRPELTPFKAGQRKRASSWRFIDTVETDDMGLVYDCRQIRHYDVLMMEFHGFSTHFDHGRGEDYRTWVVRVLSIGIGSATDQQGVNQLCGARFYLGGGQRNKPERMMLKSYGFQMYRDRKGGGPRIVYTGHPSGDHTLPL